MSLIDGVLGNASEIDAAVIRHEFEPLLANGERVDRAYKILRDYLVFTNMRLVLVDKQGLTGTKVEYHSIPYKSITHFSVETAGPFDLDAELKIWLSGTQTPIEKTFNNRLNIYEVQSVLAGYVLAGHTTSIQTAQHGEKSRKPKTSTSQRPSEQEATSRSPITNETAIDFCFHCGEALRGDEKQCRACGGLLE